MHQRSPARRVAATSPSIAGRPTLSQSRTEIVTPVVVSTPAAPTSSVDDGNSKSTNRNDPPKQKKIVRKPKYHQTARFLADEGYPINHVLDPVLGGVRVGEAYRLAATILMDANASTRYSRPVSWGYGSIDGALARNNTVQSSPMAPLAFFRRDNVHCAAAGNRLSVFLTYDDKLYQSGRLFPAQDGCGMWGPKEVKGRQVGGKEFANEESEGNCGSNLLPTKKTESRFVSVFASHYAAYAIDECGQVYSWGAHLFGQLGYEVGESKNDADIQTEETPGTGTVLGTDLSRGDAEVDVSTVSNNNQDDQEEADAPKRIPIAVNYIPRLITGLQGHAIDLLAAGDHFVIATSSSGHLFGWGSNSNGQLGLGHTDSVVPSPTRIEALIHFVPVHVSAGQTHSVGIFLPRSDSSVESATYSIVFAWGNCTLGRLGMGWTTATSVIIPRELTFFRGLGATQCAAGANHTLVLCGAGGGAGAPTFVYAFGGNEFGQLGIAMLGASFVDMPMIIDELVGVSVARIGAGARYSAALTCDGEVLAWGDAGGKKTGRADTRTTFVPWKVETPVTLQMGSGFLTQLSIGAHHAFGLFRTSGKMDRWRKFPLGHIFSALPSYSKPSDITREASSVCQHSQSRAMAPFGVYLSCRSCSTGPLCRYCVRRCHLRHTIQPTVPLAASSLESQSCGAQGFACACGDSCRYSQFPSVIHEEV